MSPEIEALIESQKKYIQKLTTIKCSNCEKPLLDIAILQETDKKTTFVVHCPYCGDSSFPTDLFGVLNIAPLDNTYMDDYRVHEQYHEVIIKCNQ